MFHKFCRERWAEQRMAAGEDGERRFGRFGHGPGRGRGPFGRHHGGPFGGRGRRMFDSGALRLVVLGLIAEQPRHGYDIIKALEERFAGAYSPSPGAIYPMLQMLEEADLVSSQTEGAKRLYTVSEAGRAYLEENRAELEKINAQLDAASGDMKQAALGSELHALRHTLFTKLRHGGLSAAQAEKLRALLQRMRQDIEDL